MLGYPNEYGLLTERPLLAPGADPAGLLPREPQARARRPRPQRLLPGAAHAAPGRGRVPRASPTPPPGTRPAGRTPTRRRCSAAKMVGRWPSGAPLSLAPGAGRPVARRQQRLRLPRSRPPRPGLPDRVTRPAYEPARLARAAARHRGVAGHQPPAPAAAARPQLRLTDIAVSECGVHFIVPQREPRPAVRVRPAHLGQQPGVQPARERDRPAGRAPPREAELLHRRRPVRPAAATRSCRSSCTSAAAPTSSCPASGRCASWPAPAAPPPDEGTTGVEQHALRQLELRGLPRHPVLAGRRRDLRPDRPPRRVGQAAQGDQPRCAGRAARHAAQVQPLRHRGGAGHQPAATRTRRHRSTSSSGRWTAATTTSTDPAMGAAGTRFGRNVPLDAIVRRLARGQLRAQPARGQPAR